MRPQNVSDPALITLLEKVRQITEFLICHMPDRYAAKNRNFEVTCQHVARIVAMEVPGLTVVDGVLMKTKVHNGYEYSWLATHNPDFIIDAYPYRMHPGPLLVFVGTLSPWCTAYSAGEPLTGIAASRIEEETRIVYDRFVGARTFLSMP